MSLIKINRHPTTKDLRVFATLWFLFLGVFAVVAFQRDLTLLARVLGAVAFAVGLMGWAKPPSVRLIYLGAVLVTFPIGFVLSHVILAIVYYLVITPIGILMRLLGRDPLNRKFDPNRKSYWEPKTDKRTPASYLRQH
ncbi:SxtJ family membrane protein [Synoicihabitans lomoniglobus]|uniref:SxtJ family membrane protein n=1 Tax=Synoicihabitans lomoniglobus TaxID=2909285 RepID=A0AAF0CR63_9BACT|nr:SxtJ family membrane protein [Opitutaceae bacterium LMO-M01]WED66550.1 SxtJ family membrane protein [Opitutaceae bacterium LMO-M01]